MTRATTLGELRASGYLTRSVRQEIRENLIERMVILGDDGEIRARDLPPQFRSQTSPPPGAPRVSADGLDFRDVVDRFETDLILQALDQTQWNKNRAAGLLGLNRTTLLEKIKKKGLDPAS